MKKQKIYFIGSCCLLILSMGLMIFLFFYPYEKVSSFSIHNVLAPFSLKVDNVEIKKHDSIIDISSSIEYLVIKSEKEQNELQEDLNIKIPFNLTSSYYSESSLIAISFQGSVMKNSKATKIKTKRDVTNISFSVENDFILDGTSTANSLEYSYYFLIVNSTNINKIKINVKKV